MAGEARSKAQFIFTVSMDVDADKEAIFNEVYDTEHIPLILKVPGVVSAKRYKMVPLTMVLGGEKKTIVMEGEPAYMAVYELETADVLTGPGWAFTQEIISAMVLNGASLLAASTSGMSTKLTTGTRSLAGS